MCKLCGCSCAQGQNFDLTHPSRHAPIEYPFNIITLYVEQIWDFTQKGKASKWMMNLMKDDFFPPSFLFAAVQKNRFKSGTFWWCQHLGSSLEAHFWIIFGSFLFKNTKSHSKPTALSLKKTIPIPTCSLDHQHIGVAGSSVIIICRWWWIQP